MITTPVTYYGGKQMMLSDILPLIPLHVVYTESYLGGGAVFFSKPKSQVETINDRSDFVVTFYEVLKMNFNALKKKIDASLVCRKHKIEATRIRKNPEDYTKVDIAWSFWYLANFSFASKLDGGLKYSNEQYSSVPMQLQKKKNAFLKHLQVRIENAVIENRCALWVLKSRNTVNAFHYLDPPYVGADQGHYKGFTENDLIDLLDCMSECKGKFLMSHYTHPIVHDYACRYNWTVKKLKKPLTATRGRSKNAHKIEILISNYDDRQMDLFH